MSFVSLIVSKFVAQEKQLSCFLFFLVDYSGYKSITRFPFLTNHKPRLYYNLSYKSISNRFQTHEDCKQLYKPNHCHRFHPQSILWRPFHSLTNTLTVRHYHCRRRRNPPSPETNEAHDGIVPSTCFG
ncbi:hypothetical protein HanXRQr2_Chr04g0145061 [Helianthus annuus]|uniref:Uncharacterized protein n=2 Tax=Helianthus annuus TaxID=4232 RepID=A0A9K3J4A7_HELAN|nr:hypothetical protein HanXRQr2_Chr04g0145061 [Helianthus annuus]